MTRKRYVQWAGALLMFFLLFLNIGSQAEGASIGPWKGHPWKGSPWNTAPTSNEVEWTGNPLQGVGKEWDGEEKAKLKPPPSAMEQLKDFFARDDVQTVLKVIGAVGAVALVIIGGVYALGAMGVAVGTSAILSSLGLGTLGVGMSAASGDTSFGGMLASGLSFAIPGLAALKLARITSKFIPASGLARYLAIGTGSGVGGVGISLLHGGLKGLFTGDYSHLQEAAKPENMVSTFLVGTVLGSAAAKAFGKSAAGKAVSKFSQKAVKHVKNSVAFSAVSGVVNSTADLYHQWKTTGEVDWKRTGKQAAVVFGMSMALSSAAFLAPSLALKACSCGDKPVVSQQVKKVEQADVGVVGKNNQILNQNDIFSEGAIKHIYHGEINKKRQAVGYHHESLMGGEVLEVTSPPNQHGVYRALIGIDGKSKRVPSTFFPKEWNRVQVTNVIKQAYQNKRLIKDNLYEGKSSNGMRIQMRLDSEGKIKTSYPIY